jgi:heme a synthase
MRPPAVSLPTVGLPLFRRLTRAGVVLLALIVVSGGAVRLTGSGLGCPTWPQCGDGSFVTRQEYSFHGWVEFGNRLITTAVGLLMLGLPLVALRLRERRRDLTLLSFGLWVGFVGQVVLGGFTVLFHLNPTLVAGHFLLSMVLLVDVIALDVRARRPGGAPPAAVRVELRWLARLLVAVGALVLLLGTAVTGSGPHGGDSAQTLHRFPFAVRAVAQVHADVAMLLVGLVVAAAFAVRAGGGSAAARRSADLLVLLVVAQAGIGFAQYFLGIPAGLVELHIAGATALWVVAVRLWLTLADPPPAAVPSAAADAPAARIRIPAAR